MFRVEEVQDHIESATARTREQPWVRLGATCFELGSFPLASITSNTTIINRGRFMRQITEFPALLDIDRLCLDNAGDRQSLH